MCKKYLGLISVLIIIGLLLASCTSIYSSQTSVASPTVSTSLPIVTSSSVVVSLISIAISPVSPQLLPIGSVQDFKATGQYSDGSTKDITSQVIWASSDTSVASMYPYGGAFANSEGTTYVTATLDGIVSPAVILSVPSNDTLLLIYLDANYSKLWDSTNQPDLSAINWKPDPNQSGSPYSWQQGILVVYLWNMGNKTLNVNAENNLNAVSPGFSVHSDIVTIKSNERTSLNIIIERSVEVWGFTGGGSFSVWFNIREAD